MARIETYSNVHRIINISIVTLTIKQVIVGRLAGIAIGYIATLYLGRNFCSLLLAVSIATKCELSLGILLGGLLVVTKMLPIKYNPNKKI